MQVTLKQRQERGKEKQNKFQECTSNIYLKDFKISRLLGDR